MNTIQKITLSLGIIALIAVYYTSPRYILHYDYKDNLTEMLVTKCLRGILDDEGCWSLQYIDKTVFTGRALIVIGLTAVIIVFSKSRK